MPAWIKDMLLDGIVLPLYLKKLSLLANNLKSFGVQGMILEDRLFPLEFNRRDRFAERKFTGMDR